MSDYENAVEEKIQKKLEEQKQLSTVAITEQQLEEIKQDLLKQQNSWLQDDYFRRWMPQWVYNCMENYPMIKQDFLKKNCCLSAFRTANKPAIIIGGGPSLDKNIHLLRDWKYPIFSSSSTAFNTLYEIEREPDFISAFDSLYITADHIANHQWKNSTLLAHTTTDPKTIKNWRWNKIYYRRMFPGNPFFEHIMPIMFPMIKIGIRFTGNVINNGITLLEFMGYNPIFLVGADLGWWDHNKPRALQIRKDAKGLFQIEPTISTKNNKNVIELENGLKIDSNMVAFKEELLKIVLSNENRKVYDCSEGFIEELPKVDLKRVIETNGMDDYGYDFELIKENTKRFFEEKRPKIFEIFNNLRKENEASQNQTTQ
jgi:hypothetical protein